MSDPRKHRYPYPQYYTYSYPPTYPYWYGTQPYGMFQKRTPLAAGDVHHALLVALGITFALAITGALIWFLMSVVKYGYR